jgi:hypothetical protein
MPSLLQASKAVDRRSGARGQSRISDATGIGKTAAAEYVHRAAVIGITWPVALSH